MPHRVTVALALTVMTCFVLLSYFDSQLFFVHLYESLIYLAIVVVLLRSDDPWAYMLGMLAPTGWLMLILIPAVWAVLLFATGVAPSIVGQIPFMFHLQRPGVPAIILEVITLILSVWMALFCLTHWRAKLAAYGKGRSTFLICMVAVVIYYGVLVVWFLRWGTVRA